MRMLTEEVYRNQPAAAGLIRPLFTSDSRFRRNCARTHQPAPRTRTRGRPTAGCRSRRDRSPDSRNGRGTSPRPERPRLPAPARATGRAVVGAAGVQRPRLRDLPAADRRRGRALADGPVPVRRVLPRRPGGAGDARGRRPSLAGDHPRHRQGGDGPPDHGAEPAHRARCGPRSSTATTIPNVSPLYPFGFRLEPLSLDSLAAYVCAESPADCPAPRRTRSRRRRRPTSATWSTGSARSSTS